MDDLPDPKGRRTSPRSRGSSSYNGASVRRTIEGRDGDGGIRSRLQA